MGSRFVWMTLIVRRARTGRRARTVHRVQIVQRAFAVGKASGAHRAERMVVLAGTDRLNFDPS